jgi:hypothetical protein
MRASVQDAVLDRWGTSNVTGAALLAQPSLPPTLASGPIQLSPNSFHPLQPDTGTYDDDEDDDEDDIDGGAIRRSSTQRRKRRRKKLPSPPRTDPNGRNAMGSASAAERAGVQAMSAEELMTGAWASTSTPSTSVRCRSVAAHIDVPHTLTLIDGCVCYYIRIRMLHTYTLFY